MGGGSGPRFTQHDLDELRREALQRLAQTRSDSRINMLLQDQLLQVNDRDVNSVNRHLDTLEGILSDRTSEFDRLLFGGSVAKHTYVDGLSDVDGLAILRPQSSDTPTPEQVRREFADAIRARLPAGQTENIRIGNLAVTVTFKDGIEIQLLPAMESDRGISISSADGKRWMPIYPRRFAEVLTEINRQNGGGVVPTIKLAKVVLRSRMGDMAPSGYHLEALATAAFDDYRGPRTSKAMLIHLLKHASIEVLSPIRDVTGQSRHVDESLGPASSPRRRQLAARLGVLGEQLDRFQINDWQSLFDNL